jgi:hypothetical protein
MGDEITMRGYRVLTSAECTTIMIPSLRLQAVWNPLKIRWFGYGMVLVMGFGIVFVEVV